MKQFLILSTLLATAYGLSIFGDLSAGFKAKFGSFRTVARNVSDIIAEGWVTVDRPDDAYLPSLTMYCPDDDYTYCTLYDELGYISGVQIAFPIENFTDPTVDMYSMGFKNWSAPAFVGGKAADYYVTSQFYISEENLAANASVRNALRASGETLYDGGVWIPDLNGDLFKLTTSRSDLDSVWKEQGCLVGMGRHYFYNTTTDGDCSQLFPWFLIYQDDAIVGTGVTAFGTYPTDEQGAESWLEKPGKLAVEIIAPNAPECLYTLGANSQIHTLHVYYVKHPLLITCIAN